MAKTLHRYDEGIGLLYMSNTFNLSGEHLLTRISDYILPGRLARMSAFEIFFPLSGSFHDDLFRPASAILSLLLNVLARSSGVKLLYLCLHYPQMWNRIVDADLTEILSAVDEFVRTSKAESTVLQMDTYSLGGLTANASALEEDKALPKQNHGLYQMWRGLDGNVGQERIDKRPCLYPRILAPLRVVASPELGPSRGYWILESHDYMMANYTCTLY
jgi:hypothetical protein